MNVNQHGANIVQELIRKGSLSELERDVARQFLSNTKIEAQLMRDEIEGLKQKLTKAEAEAKPKPPKRRPQKRKS